MASILRRLVRYASCLTLLYVAPAFGNVDTGENKGNGTLPVRMQGQLSSPDTGEVIEFDSHVVSMTLREVSQNFTTKCNLRGAAVRSFTVDGSFNIGCSDFPETLPILEICSDDEASKIEIIVGLRSGKPYRFVGRTTKILGDIVGIVGTLDPGHWDFYLDKSDDPELIVRP